MPALIITLSVLLLFFIVWLILVGTKKDKSLEKYSSLRFAHREDLIGSGPECLVSAGGGKKEPTRAHTEGKHTFGGQYIPAKANRSKKDAAASKPRKSKDAKKPAAKPSGSEAVFPRKKATALTKSESFAATKKQPGAKKPSRSRKHR